MNTNLKTNKQTNGYHSHPPKNDYTTVLCSFDDEIQKPKPTKPDNKPLGEDFKKVMFLIYLYFLQGIPLGLCASMPFLMSARGFSYSDQGTFSFANWPFSLKIFWAPLVDSIYSKRIGRRKSWLIPVQFLMALFLFTCADRVQSLINTGKTRGDIIFLTFVFSVFITLAATQDIAVDGWAISMLSRENVSWQATCNFTGQAIGYFFGNIIFIVLESEKFSNQYIRPFFSLPAQPHGIITLKMFMYSFGCIFIFTTFLILFFINENSIKSKSSEKDLDEIDEKQLNLVSSYIMIWKMLNLVRVRELAWILLTSRIGWATDAVLFLKLIDYGVSKESIALLTIPLIPVNVLWPVVVSKWTKGPNSLILYRTMLPVKLIMVLTCCVYMYFLRDLRNDFGEYDYKLYIISFTIFAVNTIIDLTRATSMAAFMARVSDESIGGTYMTFLNTLGNLGGKYPATAALYLINWLTLKYCVLDLQNSHINDISMMLPQNTTTLLGNKCSTTKQTRECRISGGVCITTFDAYFYLTLFLVAMGLAWLLVYRKMFRVLSNSEKSEWKLVK